MADTDTDEAAQRANHMLQQMYKSGEHADFIIRTSTRDFHVHKCVVSQASSFFAGACRGQFKEAQTGVIEVPESAQIIEALVQHMYTVPIECLPRSDMTEIDDHLETFNVIVEVQVAADKYLIDDIALPIRTALAECLDRDASLIESVEMACKATSFWKGAELGMLPVMYLSLKMSEVLKDAEAWALLLAYPNVLKLAMRFQVAAMELQDDDQTDDDAWYDAIMKHLLEEDARLP